MIVERHYDDETLIALMGTRVDGAMHDPHLLSCSSCSETLGSYRAVTDVLGDAAVWDFKDFPVEPPTATLAGIRSASKQFADEDAAAVGLVNELLAKSRSSWITEACRDLRYQTVGVIRRLVEVSEGILNTKPPEALEVARAATEIGQLVDVLESVSSAVAKARAAAWRQYSYSLFYTGDIAKAVEAEATARQTLDGCAGAEYDLGRIAILRSVIAAVQDRYDDAAKAAREAARVFAAFGDARRLGSALEAEAYALLYQSNYRDALSILLRIERDFGAYLDPYQRATGTANVGLCYFHTGRIADALQKYQLAAVMHEQNGSITEAARMRMNVAELLAAEGHHAEAKHRLRRVQTEFEQLGMHGDAISASLLLAEVLLVEGGYSEVVALCRAAMQHFERTGLAQTTDGLTALQYLTEAAGQRKATPQTVRQVRTYVERVRTEPALLFAPPPSAPD